jgi:zinc transport system substrate-binding protein
VHRPLSRLGLTLAALALAACASPPPTGDTGGTRSDREEDRLERPLQVVVSVPPQAYFVQQIAGPRAEVTVLLPPGSTPEIAAPSPRQMVALTRADLVVLVGHPHFAFERRHVLPVLARHPEIATVSMAASLGTEPAGTDDDRDATDHAHSGEGDPHLWVAPGLVREAARAIAGTLSRIDPDGAPVYRRGLTSFEATIDGLDTDVHREVDDLAERAFLVYHPAWSHFAEEYDLEQMAIETEGKEPSLRHVVDLTEEARRRGIRVIFAQPGYPSRSAGVVAGELGARVVTLDPLSPDWPGTLRSFARALGAGGRRDGHRPPAAATVDRDTARKNPPAESFHG